MADLMDAVEMGDERETAGEPAHGGNGGGGEYRALLPSLLDGGAAAGGWKPAPTLWERLKGDPRAIGLARVAGPALAVIGVQLVVFPIPVGVYLYGIVLGLLGALVAVGMALVYRANRIINFAQGQLGVVPAVLAASLVIFSGVNLGVAFIAGVVAAGVLGLAVERLIIRRFFQAPRLILTVATIGLAQLLIVAGLALPLLWGQDPIAITTGSMRLPLDFTFEVGAMVFNANHVLAMVLGPLMLFGVIQFLRATDTGMAVRATAERADRASLLGIPVGRVNTLVWVIATVLSFGGIFLRALILGLPLTNPLLAFSAALTALAALTLGRLTDLPSVTLSAIALGVLEQAVIWNHGNNPELVYPVMALVVMVGLAVRRIDRMRGEQDSVATWRSSDDVRPVPRGLQSLREVRSVRMALTGLVLVVAIIFPLLLGSGDQLKAAAVIVFALVGLSIVVLTGWAGQVSLGQMALAGYGAAFGAVAFLNYRWDAVLAIPVAGLVGAAVAVLVGLPALRLRGIFLAATTLAFSVASGSYFLSQRHLGWIPKGRIESVTVGRFITIDSPAKAYFLCLAIAVVMFAAVAGIRRSRTGRVLMALRENESAARAHGVSVSRAKLTGFAISGAIAGVAGCLYVIVVYGYSETLFAPSESVAVFTSTVVGGVGSMVGAVIGALFSRGGAWFLEGNWVYLPSAVGVLLVLWLMPGGLTSLLYRARNKALEVIAKRKGIPFDLSPPRSAGPEPRGTRDATRIPVTPPTSPAGVVLVAEGLDVAYGNVQVLFGVEMHVASGEILALLGTNGAGKSTLLKAISGLLAPRSGTIHLDGEEITRLAPHHIAALGIVQMPGGRGVFPSLTVEENVRLAGWLDRHGRRAQTSTEPDHGPPGDALMEDRLGEILSRFPILSARWQDRVADLSGGQQQMLSLAMAFLARPRVLLIDELSIGLAPIVVERLLEVVREIAAAGTAVVLVEQSVTTALGIADRAVFMEKGEVRFDGRSQDLLDRPDLLRSVFLEGAASAMEDAQELGRRDARQGGRTARERHASSIDGINASSSLERLAKSNDASTVAPTFEIRGVSVTFGGIRAVDDVSLGVEPGEIVGIIGPNGAGKTTLFDVISGTSSPDHGLVLLDGTDLAHLPPDERARRGIARSFQDARLYPALTVEQTLAVALDRWLPVKDPFRAAMRSGREREVEREVAQRVDELIALLGLERYRNAFVHELSTGTRRIVDLGCVLAHHPTVVLLDEPSSGIAQRESEALAPLLRRVREVLGATMLVVEHDMTLVSAVADRLVALDQGRVVADGTPDEVLSHPAVVASYLGAAATGAPAQEVGLDGGDRSTSGPGGDVIDVSVSAAGAGGGGPDAAALAVAGGGRPGWRTMASVVGTAIAVVAVVALGGGGGSGDSLAVHAPTAAERARVPEKSVVPVIYQEAMGSQRDTVTWVDNCDPSTGRIQMPSVYAPPCVPKFEGDNGGSTSVGVTADTIKLAVYQPQGANDIRALLQNVMDDPDAVNATLDRYVEMFNDIYETYGRKVELVRFQASGTMDDEVAARADAIKLATEIRPFASIGGPPLTAAYAEELATRGVLCIECGLSDPDSSFQRNAPFMWGPLPTPEEYLLSVGDFLFNRVAKRPASYAGDERLRDKQRVFGTVHFEQKVPVFAELEKLAAQIGEARGFKQAASETYSFELEKMPERATTIIAKLKQAGVTTVMFLGDPIMPIYLTKAATDQGYYPEWIVTGTVLTDTTTFGRRYDQKQWSHAFGLSVLPVQTRKEMGEAWRLHQWYFGEGPAAVNTSQLVYQAVNLFFLGVHLAGANLRPETFRDGMFHYPVSGGGPTTPRISFGRNGLYISEDLGKRTDYLGIDDMTEIWWDAEAEGPDETGKQGRGMWRYANGGVRYLPGDMPKTDTDAFRREGSILLYEQIPERDVPPKYPSPRAGG